MGLTYQACGTGATKESLQKTCSREVNYVIALAGNPNTGKSTVFNALTGLNQHTGNWPGKTVLRAEGVYIDQGLKFKLIDLPGTYSLLANSAEEQVARDYLCFGKPAAVIAVVDATCLERNLNLVLQILEITSKVVVCVNLIDEAKRKHINIDIDALADELGVPVVATAARDGYGLDKLVNTVTQVALGKINPSPYLVRYNDELERQIAVLEPKIKRLFGNEFNSRWLALRFLEQDETIIHAIKKWQKSSSEFTGIGGEILA